GFPSTISSTACALNSAVYRFLIIWIIVAYSPIAWSRFFTHLTELPLVTSDSANKEGDNS
ncbi:MAG: hypothetical protein PHQ12_12755, partial [Chthoniobacteraceae bacterium]|nr:hypothetical protein [Chthoniobacteraceae bacterium]